MCILTLRTHVAGERLYMGAYGKNCSVSNLSPEVSAPGKCVVDDTMLSLKKDFDYAIAMEYKMDTLGVLSLKGTCMETCLTT